MRGRPLKNQEAIERFSANFNRIYAEQALTLQIVADALNLRVATISAWRNALAMPTQKNLNRLANFLNVSRNELVSLPHARDEY